MTQDISKMTKTTEGKEPPAKKEFWIVEIFKMLLGFNMMKYGTKKKF